MLAMWPIEGHLDQMEFKFSEFLLDLAEYWKVGLSMTTAITTIADGEYGALNKQIRKMSTQISWGVARTITGTGSRENENQWRRENGTGEPSSAKMLSKQSA